MRFPARGLAGLALAAAALAGPATAKTTLTAALGLVPWKSVGHLPGSSARGAYEKYLAAHPAVYVTEFERLWLPGQHWSAAQVMSLAAGAGPDLLRIGFDELGGYVREGLVQKLDALVENADDHAR